MSEKQLAALARSSQKKKQNTLLKTEEAIATLINEKQKITIRAVARKAGVSVSYIYKYPELAYKIQTLREKQKYSLSKHDKFHLNQNDCLEIIEENEKLIQEIKQLKDHISKIKTGKHSLNSLQQENIKLLTENQQLRRELGYANKNLREARDFILNQGRDESETATENKIRKIEQM